MTAEVRFENGAVQSTQRTILVNDVPSVDIWGAGLEDAGETHELEAEIENEYGDTTVTWYVNGEQVAAGETYEHTYREEGDNVTVVVRDEYGATDRDSQQFRGMTGFEARLPRTVDPEGTKMLLGGAFGALVLFGAFLVRRR